MAEQPDVIEIPQPHRSDLLIAFLRATAARNQVRAAEAQVEALIQKLDKDGTLTKAILAARTLQQSARDEQLKLNAFATELQGKLGLNFEGYAVDPVSGNLKKMETSSIVKPKGKKRK